MHTRKGLRLEDDVDLFLQALHEMTQEDTLSQGANGFSVGSLFQKIKTIVDEEPLKTNIWDYASVREFADTLTRRRILNRIVNDNGLPLYSVNVFMEQASSANVKYSRRTPLLSSAKRSALLSVEEAKALEEKASCREGEDCFYDSNVYMFLRQPLKEGEGVVKLCIQDRWGYPYMGKISDLIPHDHCLVVVSKDRNRTDFVVVDFAVYERENANCTEAAVQIKENIRYSHPKGQRVYVIRYCPYVPAPPAPCPIPQDETNIMFFELKSRSPRGDNSLSIRDKDHFLEDLIANAEGPVTVILNSKKYVVDSVDLGEDHIDVILTTGLSTSAEKGAIAVFSSDLISVQKCACNASFRRKPERRVRRARSSAAAAPEATFTYPSTKNAIYTALIIDGNTKGSTKLVLKGDYDALIKIKDLGTKRNQFGKILSARKNGDDTITVLLENEITAPYSTNKGDQYATFSFEYTSEKAVSDEVLLGFNEALDGLQQTDFSSLELQTVLEGVDEPLRFLAFVILTNGTSEVLSATPTDGNRTVLEISNVSPQIAELLGDPIDLCEKPQEPTAPEEPTAAPEEPQAPEAPTADPEVTQAPDEPTASEETPTIEEDKAMPLPILKAVPPIVVITYYDANNQPMQEKHMISLVEYQNDMMPVPIPGAESYSIETP